MSADKMLDILMAASAGCMLDMKRRLMDYILTDPLLSLEEQQALTEKFTQAEKLAGMLAELVQDMDSLPGMGSNH